MKVTDKTSGLTAELLRERLRYEPRTGVFAWLRRSELTRADKIFNTRFAGSEAGCICPRGYRYIRLRGFGIFAAARLAWLYMTGEWPEHEVDHRSTDNSDNSWENLRAATRGQNGSNRRMQKNNRSGLKGIYPERDGKWAAQIRHDNKQHHLGRFETPEQAHAAYAEASRRLHGEFGRAA